MKSVHVSIDQVPKLAETIAAKLRGGEVLALVGPLGAGKTTFTQYLGKALGIRKKITSPTFVLMQQYRGRIRRTQAASKPVTLYHLDLYRTENFRAVEALGIAEIWNDASAITVIEWADKIKKHLPKHTTYIYPINPHLS